MRRSRRIRRRRRSRKGGCSSRRPGLRSRGSARPSTPWPTPPGCRWRRRSPPTSRCRRPARSTIDSRSPSATASRSRPAITRPRPAATTSPVVLLVHERERSSKDFEESIAELKKLSPSPRSSRSKGTPSWPSTTGARRQHPEADPLPEAEWPAVVNDLQAAYYCLVDRHNRDELNLAKLGVVALGEGANVAPPGPRQGGGGLQRGAGQRPRRPGAGLADGRRPEPGALRQGRRSPPWPPGSPSTSWPASATPPPPPWSTTGRPRSRPSSSATSGPTRSRPSPRPSTATSSLQFEPNMTSSVFQFLESHHQGEARRVGRPLSPQPRDLRRRQDHQEPRPSRSPPPPRPPRRPTTTDPGRSVPVTDLTHFAGPDV